MISVEARPGEATQQPQRACGGPSQSPGGAGFLLEAKGCGFLPPPEWSQEPQGPPTPVGIFLPTRWQQHIFLQPGGLQLCGEQGGKDPSSGPAVSGHAGWPSPSITELREATSVTPGGSRGPQVSSKLCPLCRSPGWGLGSPQRPWAAPTNDPPLTRAACRTGLLTSFRSCPQLSQYSSNTHPSGIFFWCVYKRSVNSLV